MNFQETLRWLVSKDGFYIMKKGMQSFFEMCSSNCLGHFYTHGRFSKAIVLCEEHFIFSVQARMWCDFIENSMKAMWINSIGMDHIFYVLLNIFQKFTRGYRIREWLKKCPLVESWGPTSLLRQGILEHRIFFSWF